MKVALVIHWFLLALVGGLAWHAGGSPFQLACSMLALLAYPLLGFLPARLEPFKRITCALLLIISGMQGGNKPIMLWSCLLALPQLLSAIQCVWEIQHAGKFKTVESAGIKRSVFTLGFYATMGLVFLLLRPDFFGIEPSASRMIALVCTMLGLVAWEASRTARLQEGNNTPLTDKAYLMRHALIGSGALIFILLFAFVLPFASDALCGFSAKVKAAHGSDRRKPIGKPAGRSGEGPSLPGPEQANRTGQVELPMRGTLELSDEIRVILRFEDPNRSVKPTRQRPLYVRTLAASRFEDGEWKSDGNSGQWLKDAGDGRQDDKVEVGRHSTEDIPHEIFLLRSNGQALPALAGVTAYALPEVLALPDDWYQNPASGDIRYKAWSRPVDIQSISTMKPEAGNPGPAYLTRLESPLGARLTETADRIGAGRTDLSGRLESLRQFFETNFIYTTTVVNDSNSPPLENFLFAEKRGYCDFFASASALLLRHMGIPSRVACGYMGGEPDPATDSWIFQEFHAHSWTEVYVEGRGWVICDFTPPSSESPSLAGTPPPSLNLAAFQDAGTGGLKRESKRSHQAASHPSAWVPAILVLGWLVTILGILFLKHRTPEQRATRIAARRRAKSEQQPDYLLEFLNMCQSLGHTRLPGQTLMEFLRDLKQARFCHDDFDELIDYYYKSRYENAPPDRTSKRRFLKLIRSFSKAKAREI